LFVAATAVIAVPAAAGSSLFLSKYRLAGKLDLVAFLADALDHDLLSFLELVANVFDTPVGYLGDVQKSVEARKDLDECAEVEDSRNCSEICLPDLGFGRERPDPCDRSLSGLTVGRGDRDRTVVLDVDLRHRLFPGPR